MSVLSPPRHEIVNKALASTREICKGEIIDGSTVLRHAVGVVITLEEFIATVEPTLAAGIILHDTPYSAKDQTELDALLRDSFGEETHRIVRTIEREHSYMGKEYGQGLNEALEDHIDKLVQDEPVLLATAADKITAFRSIVRRAQASENPELFWSQRPAFIARMPYFRGFHEKTAPYLPQPMADTLGTLVDQADHTPTF